MKKSRSDSQPNKIPHDGRIAAIVKKKAAAGVPVSEILASIQNYQNAPRSLPTFYRIYRDDMDEARGGITEKIGSKIVAQALDGDYKSQELWLTTKGGWSKNQTVTNIDAEYSEEEKSNALNNLLTKLGLNDEEETVEE